MDRQNNSYRLGLYEKSMPSDLTWKEKLIIAKESGFDYLEMSIDESDAKLSRLDWSEEQREKVRQAMRETDEPISSICLSGHRKYPLGSKDTQIQRRSLEIMEKAIQLAADLGIRLIQLAGYDVYYEQGDEYTRADFEANLKKCVTMAARHGVILGFETMETPFMDTVEKSMYYVEKIKSPYLGVYPDIGNLKNASLLYGKSVNEDLQTGQGHLFAAHLKETIPDHYREIPFGTGHTEYTENIEKLKELGVRMFVGEFWYTGNKEWKKDVKDAAVFLRNKLDPVFEEVTA